MEKTKREEESSLLLRIFISIYIFLLIVISFLLAFSSQIICCVIFFPLILYNKKYRLIILGSCFRYFCYLVCSPLNPFWKIKIARKCKKNYKPSKTLLFVNHLSSVDPWIVSSCVIPWETKFVFKSTLLKVPFAGQSLFLSGDIPVYFTKSKSGWELEPGNRERIMKICKEYQDYNISTIVFPEGTRSLSGELQLFKSGFFRFAIENKCEVLPCALHGTNKIWPIKKKLLDKGTVYFSFGDPIIPTPDMTYEELKNKTRESIFNLIKEFPDYDEKRDKLSTQKTLNRGHGL